MGKKDESFYIFLHNKFAQNVLQMPHRQKDLYTGEIGLSLLIEGNFAAGAWNSVSRYYFQGNKKVSADLADFSQSYFIAFSKAFALCHSKGHIIQLHGFSTKKRRTRADKQSSFILSAGSWNQSKRLINHHNDMHVIVLEPCEESFIRLPAHEKLRFVRVNSNDKLSD